MRLKKLEITGFKSFANRSSIEFPEGISAIVGPNGCGKSNIVDALKWAMGEQSVKQLRGKSMDDVIFSGTSGMPPLNMAEVSLVIENNNGNAPEELKDLTEIMLTRRLYRNGDSGYFINKRPCRLKDIHHLFMGSGMGAKSYSVIQQGNIGTITDAGPEERRHFLEDAAGITRYKTRKADTLRKIDITRQNLLRLKDIIGEVERQMNSLQRQAKKAERFQRYKERIRRLDILLQLHDYHELAHQIDETAGMLKGFEDENIERMTRIKQLDAAVEKIKLERAGKSQEISNLKTDRHQSQRDIDKKENDALHFRKEIHRLGGEIEALKASRHELKGKNESMDQEISQVQEENTRLENEVCRFNEKIREKQEQYERVKSEYDEINRIRDDYQSKLTALLNRKVEYKSSYENMNLNRENVERRLKRIDEEEITARRKMADLESAEQKALEELQWLKDECAELDDHIASLRGEVDGKREKLAAEIKHVQALDLSRNKIKSRHTALKRMDDNMEWYRDGVRSLMEDCRKGAVNIQGNPDNLSKDLKESGLPVILADVIAPEPSYETALESALNESLNHVIVGDQASAALGIEHLKSQRSGRCGFIPLSVTDGTQSSIRFNGYEKLLDHVQVRRGFEPLIQSLLGTVILTEDLDKALETYNKTNGQFTVATRKGELVTQRGIIVGGSEEKLDGILLKKQELKTLEQRLQELDQQIEERKAVRKNLESEMIQLEKDLQKQVEQKNFKSDERLDAEKSLFRISEENRHARRNYEKIRTDKEQLLDEAQDMSSRISLYNQKMRAIEDEIRVMQTEVSQVSEKIRHISDNVETLTSEISDQRLNLNSANARLENGKNVLKRLKDFQQDSTQRLASISIDIDKKEEKRNELEKRVDNHQKALMEGYQEMEALDQRIQESMNEFASMDARLDETDRSISEIKTERDEIRQKIQLLELEQSQRQIRRDNIVRQLETQYFQSVPQLETEFKEDLSDPNLKIEELKNRLTFTRKKIDTMRDVNLGAINEYETLKTRFDFLCSQQTDLEQSIEDLKKVITKINRISQQRFLDMFNRVNEQLEQVFPRLFDGGTAKLVLVEPDKPLETGVEFMVHPPGKKLTRLSLLSGGEKALSAIAFIFSIFMIKKASFCIMDEIDAPLDEANVFRFNELLKIIKERTQIVMITHNKKTMEFADTLFGVTMEKKGVSQIVSVSMN